MNEALEKRLNQVFPKLVSDEFLTGKGLGNELGFYIFDYPPEEELRMREFLKELTEQISRKRPDIKVCHTDLFEFVLDYLRDRDVLEKSIEMQKAKGNESLKKALSGVLHESKLGPIFAEKTKPNAYDIILLSGVGSAFPLLRSHTLLNNLQPVVDKPLVIFYPGKYDHQTLRLFGKIKSAGYYRAFKLIS